MFEHIFAVDLLFGEKLDDLMRTVVMLAQAATMYVRARKANACRGFPALDVLMKTIIYSLVGGPAGAAVGLIWERDKLLLKQKNKINPERIKTSK